MRCPFLGMISLWVFSLSPVGALSLQLWDDGFDGSSFNANWTTANAGTGSVLPFVNEGLAVFNAGTGGFNRSLIRTNRASTGAEAALFEGNPAYNFFRHDLSVKVTGLAMPHEVSAGTAGFFTMITDPDSLGVTDGPRATYTGTMFEVSRTTNRIFFRVTERIGSARTTNFTKDLNAVPSEISFLFTPDGWKARMTGTTFTDGSSWASGSWTQVSASLFDSVTPEIRTGAYNEGTVTTTSEETSISIERLQLRAQALPPVEPVLWKEFFQGTAFNEKWSLQNFGTSGFQNDAAFFDAGAGAFNRVFIRTDNSQNQDTGDFPADFNREPAYNFFLHELEIKVSDLSIPADVTSGSLNFFTMISNATNAGAGPRNGLAGAYLRVFQDGSQLGLRIGEATGTNRFENGKNLLGMPELITVRFNAYGWNVRIEGGTFTDGSTWAHRSWTNISAAMFDSVYPDLRIGAYNETADPATTGGSTQMSLGGLEVSAGTDTTPVTPMPRIGVREAQPHAQFYDKTSGKEFFPIGSNYIRLDDVLHVYHVNFVEQIYDPNAVEVALAQMAAGGFTVVRVWVYHGHWQLRAMNPPLLSVGGPYATNTPELHQPYIRNLIDFLRRANRNGIYVHLVIDREPENEFYRGNLSNGWPDVEGIRHREFMVPASLDAKEIYINQLIGNISSRDPGLLSTVFAYEIRNEVHINDTELPFSQTSGVVQTAAGAYDMGIPASRQAAFDDNVLAWLNRSIAAVKSADPDALTTTSIFSFEAVGKDGRINDGLLPIGLPAGGGRWPLRPAVVMASNADFLSFHSYIPPTGIPNFTQAITSSEWNLLDHSKKPTIAGEFGKLRELGDVATAAADLYAYRENMLDAGFRGASLFTWDTASHFRWAALEQGGLVYERIKPEAFTRWDFNYDGLDGFWTPGNGITSMNTSNGRLQLVLGGPASSILSPTCRIDTSSRTHLKIMLQNGTAGSQAQLYWTTKNDSTWNEAKSIPLSISNFDVKMQTYIVDLSTHPAWNGIVNRLRFHPVADSPHTGTYQLDDLGFYEGDPRLQSYAEWARAAFPRRIPEDKRLPAVDLTGSGIPNLFAYAFGMNPMEPQYEYMPMSRIEQSQSASNLVFRYRRNRFTTGLDCIPEVSENLVQWSPSLNQPQVTDSEADAIWYEIYTPVEPDVSSKFLRLRLE